MKSNYKQLGDYIERCDDFNEGMEVKQLLGISNKKYFVKAKTNTIGINLQKYRIVRNNQFAFNRATTRNGEKLSIALRDGNDCIVSPSYRIFKVKDETKLLSEYLMMWFRRPEFDRYARFKSHGSAHEFFGWKQLCEVTLPIPTLEKQTAIVKEYQTITNRITLNEQLNEKLEATAQTLYKHWFVDFDFPNEQGLPYQSNGGEMVWNEDLEMDVPLGWKVVTIGDFCIEMKNGATPKRGVLEYWNKEDIAWLKTGEVSNNILLEAEEYISKLGFAKSSTKKLPINTVLMAMYGATAAQVSFLKFQATTNQACCAMICKNINEAAYLFYHLLVNQKYISSLSIGGAQANLSKAIIEELFILKPNNNLLEKDNFQFIINKQEMVTRVTSLLKGFSSILLQKMAKS
jgi:type I restriction enzyme S subunit